MAGQLRFLLQESEDVRKHLDLLGIPHARGNLPVGQNARVRDIHFDTVVATRGALIWLYLLDAGERPLDQVVRLERNPVTRPVLDLFPKRLKVRRSVALPCGISAPADPAH